jgi:hypothetical protein
LQNRALANAIFAEKRDPWTTTLRSERYLDGMKALDITYEDFLNPHGSLSSQT